MSPSIPFFIPDTSPIFLYSPCDDCSTNGTWQSAYSSRGDGYDVTFHQTKSARSSIVFNTTAASINVQTALDGSCSASYSLDGQSFNDGCNITLDGTQQHQVEIRPQTGQNGIHFFGMSGSSNLASGGRYLNQTIDSSSTIFVYSSNDWTHLSQRGTTGTISNQTIVTEHSGDIAKFSNQTASITTSANAQVELTFKGSAIYLYGTSAPSGGTADIYIDDQLANSIDFENSAWNSYSALLYFRTDFDTSQDLSHKLGVKSTSAGSEVTIDYALVSVLQLELSNDKLPVIIGSIAGSSAFLLISGVIFYCYISRLRSRSRRADGSSFGQATYAFSTGIEGGKVNAIDIWRKNAAAAKTSPISDSSPHRQLSFSDALAYHSVRSGSTSADGRVRQLRYVGGSSESRRGGSATSSSRRNRLPDLGHPYGSPKGSPPPEYPDFIPYHGPIEPPPSAVTRSAAEYTGSDRVYNWPTSRKAVPSIEPIEDNTLSPNTRVEGWVNGVQAAGTPILDSTSDRSDHYALTGKSDHSLHSPSQRKGVGAGNEMREIPVTPYSVTQLDNLQSPASSLSSAAEGEMTSRAVRAKGSVARIWPNNPTPHVSAGKTVIAGGAPAPSSFRFKDPFQSTLDPTNLERFSDPSASMFDTTTTASPLTTLSPVHTRDRRAAAADSMRFAPTYTIAGNFISSTDQLIGSRFASSFDQSMVNQGGDGSSPRTSSPAATLRRGVSIKSVKTMRSFFSALLWNNSQSSGSPVRETPALPGQIQAARPDSGIFPMTRNNSIAVTRQKSRIGRNTRRGAKSRTPNSTNSPGSGQMSSVPGSTRTPGSSRAGAIGLERMPSFGTRYMDALSQYELASTFHPWSLGTGSGGGSASGLGSGTHSANPSTVQTPPSALRLECMPPLGESPHLFIELNPNSPVTVAPSRPDSEMTSYWR